MTDEEAERLARERLNAALDKFTEEVREVIMRKVNDSISVDEVATGDNMRVLHIMLGWVQRIMFETVHDDLGEKLVAHHFDNAYYQICSQHIGPEDFAKVAKPYST